MLTERNYIATTFTVLEYTTPLSNVYLPASQYFYNIIKINSEYYIFLSIENVPNKWNGQGDDIRNTVNIYLQVWDRADEYERELASRKKNRK